MQAEVDRLTEEQEEMTARQAQAIYSDVDSMIRALEAEGYTVTRSDDGEEDTAEE